MTSFHQAWDQRIEVALNDIAEWSAGLRMLLGILLGGLILGLVAGVHHAVYLSQTADEARMIERLNAHANALRSGSIAVQQAASALSDASSDALFNALPDAPSSSDSSRRAQPLRANSVSATEHPPSFERLSVLAKLTGLSLQSLEIDEARQTTTGSIQLRASGSFERTLQFLLELRQSMSFKIVSAEVVERGGLLAIKLDMNHVSSKRRVPEHVSSGRQVESLLAAKLIDPFDISRVMASHVAAAELALQGVLVAGRKRAALLGGPEGSTLVYVGQRIGDETLAEVVRGQAVWMAADEAAPRRLSIGALK